MGLLYVYLSKHSSSSEDVHLNLPSVSVTKIYLINHLSMPTIPPFSFPFIFSYLPSILPLPILLIFPPPFLPSFSSLFIVAVKKSSKHLGPENTDRLFQEAIVPKTLLVATLRIVPFFFLFGGLLTGCNFTWFFSPLPYSKRSDKCGESEAHRKQGYSMLLRADCV